MEKMILEGLGNQKEHIDTHLETLAHSLHLSRYGDPVHTDTNMSLQAHRGDNMITTIIHHWVEGLEVQAKNMSWFTVPTDPGKRTSM